MPIININLGYFVDLGFLPLPQMMWRLFLDGAWIPILIIVGWGVWELFFHWRQVLYANTLTYTVLAIDVPHLNEQSPKAVEQIFSGLYGSYLFLDKIEEYWKGMYQPTISMEIVSIGGHVQFLVRCQTRNRDLVEACIYSQYPDAEITEVEDYAAKVELPLPNETTNAFGIEFILARPTYLPIKTYIQFEHNLSEEYFKDPMSQVLEVFGSIKPGEQLWVQFLITPIDTSWRKESQKAADKMVGREVAKKKNALEHLADIPVMAAKEMAGVVMPLTPEAPPKKSSDAMPRMLALTPNERETLEGIQNKAAKLGFKSKIRMVYIGDRAVFSKGRVMTGLMGCFAQFNSLHLNGLRGYGKTMPKSNYFWQKWTQVAKTSRIIRYYRRRTNFGGPTYILNTEELATLWHFPYVHVKAPLVKKTEAKRAEPPMGLPTEGMASGGPFTRVKPAGAAPAAPPPPKAETPYDEDEEFLRNLPTA
ncbi:MAG: hypothetical protein PHT12_04555 [Patescibacteria group bacterium]|nr:hypothetical protein [Patescibacteria group bacterium]